MTSRTKPLTAKDKQQIASCLETLGIMPKSTCELKLNCAEGRLLTVEVVKMKL